MFFKNIQSGDDPNYTMKQNIEIQIPEKKKIKVIKRAPLYRRLIDRIKSLIRGSSNDKITFIKEFFFYVLVYGLLINYMLTGIFGLRFDILFFPSYGILFYLIKEEFPQICAKLIPHRKQ